MRAALLGLVALLALGGCAPLTPARSAHADANESLRVLAHDLGSTHASLAACSNVAPRELEAHLESARLALNAQAGARLADVVPDFEAGLLEPARLGTRLHVACSCASALVQESRQHNLALFRKTQLPLALRRAE